MRINTNTPALTAQRNLGVTAAQMAKSVERLSSGLRINRAADDAAGLSISQKLWAQARGLAQGIRNAQDGVSMIQTAEGALDEVHAILQRARELALQASNDTLTDDDRAEIQLEIDQLENSLDGISANTKFNGKGLLDGSTAAAELVVGYEVTATTTITVAFTDIDWAGLGLGAASVATQADAKAMVALVDTAIKSVSDQRSTLGAIQNRLEHDIASLGVAQENITASKSRIQDLDVAAEMVTFTKLQILQQAGTAVLAQANQTPQSILQLLR
mgnify:CR=1 FL=1